MKVQQQLTEQTKELTPLSQTVNGLNLQHLIRNAPIAEVTFNCQFCEDSESGFKLQVYYSTGKLERCECSKERLRKERFCQAIEQTPQKFKWIIDGLGSIPERPDLHPDQPKVLENLKKNPASSVYFFGSTGTHKTTMAWAMLQEAGRRGWKVGGNTGGKIADVMREYQFDKKLPKNVGFYSTEQLENNGEKFCLLIDEIENFKMSDYGFGCLFEIVEKVQTYEQQLIITSNKSLDDLIAEWLRMDRDGKARAENYCEKLARRLTEICVPVNLMRQ